jgi:hypothetical protein
LPARPSTSPARFPGRLQASRCRLRNFQVARATAHVGCRSPTPPARHSSPPADRLLRLRSVSVGCKPFNIARGTADAVCTISPSPAQPPMPHAESFTLPAHRQGPLQAVSIGCRPATPVAGWQGRLQTGILRLRERLRHRRPDEVDVFRTRADARRISLPVGRTRFTATTLSPCSRHFGRRGPTAAGRRQSDLKTIADKIVQAVQVMDAFHRLRFAHDPERLAAWENASTVFERSSPSTGQGGPVSGTPGNGTPGSGTSADVRPAAALVRGSAS